MKTIKLNDVSIEVTKEQLQEALAEFDKPVFDYPLAFIGEHDKAIVLFDSLRSGTVIKKGNCTNSRDLGETFNGWIPHTHNYWEPIPYDAERGFYHKQPVYCWDNDYSHQAVVRFYNAEKKKTFDSDGNVAIAGWDNYSATMPDHMLEFKE